LGNAVLVVGAFPYYLQYAKGDLHLHLIGSALLTMLLIPSLIWATINYGAVGAGWAWLISHTLGFLLWIPVVHRRFERGLHLKWLLTDVLPMAAGSAISAWLFSMITVKQDERIGAIAFIFLMGMLMFATVFISSNTLRRRTWQLIKRRIL